MREKFDFISRSCPLDIMDQNTSENTPSQNIPADKLIMQAIGFDLTPAIKTHVTEQMDRLFRHEPEIERIDLFFEELELKNTTKTYKLAARIAVPGPDIAFEHSDEDFYGGVTQLSHKLDRQLRRRSRKATNHKNRRSAVL